MVFCGRHGFRTFTLNFKTEMFFKNVLHAFNIKRKYRDYLGQAAVPSALIHVRAGAGGRLERSQIGWYPRPPWAGCCIC